jgi:hypothetical protein
VTEADNNKPITTHLGDTGGLMPASDRPVSARLVTPDRRNVPL